MSSFKVENPWWSNPLQLEKHCFSNTYVHKNSGCQQTKITAYSKYNIIKIVLSCFSRIFEAEINNKKVYLSTKDVVKLYNTVYNRSEDLNVSQFNKLFKEAVQEKQITDRDLLPSLDSLQFYIDPQGD